MPNDVEVVTATGQLPFTHTETVVADAAFTVESVTVDAETVVVSTMGAQGLPGPPGADGDPGPPGTTDHGALTGLGDDDHPQYVKAAGDTMTGPLAMENDTPITFNDSSGSISHDGDDLVIFAGGQVSFDTGSQTASGVKINNKLLNVTDGVDPTDGATVGQVAALSGLTLIASSTVSGSSVATIDFSSIPDTYTHLRLYIIARGTNASAQLMNVRFNNDSGANYGMGRGQRSGPSAWAADGVASGTAANVGTAAGSGAAAGDAMVHFVDIPFYAGTTWNKVTLAMRGGGLFSSQPGIGVVGGVWNSTAAINRITLLLAANNFDIGSVVYLYGIG